MCVWTEKKKIEKLRYMHDNPMIREFVKHPLSGHGAAIVSTPSAAPECLPWIIRGVSTYRSDRPILPDKPRRGGWGTRRDQGRGGMACHALETQCAHRYKLSMQNRSGRAHGPPGETNLLAFISVRLRIYRL